MESYIELMELVERSAKQIKTAQAEANEGEQKNDEEKVQRAARMEQDLDADIEAGLEQLVRTQEEVSPRHLPQPVVDAAFRGDVGDVPVGKVGMGRVVEGGLRLLANRVGHEWEDPKQLARRLVAGELVKFRTVNEKNTVVKLAAQMSKEAGGEAVGFAPLAPEARKALMERLVQGRYERPGDAALKSNVMRNIARLTNGNPTYPAASRETLLKTIQSMLPAERAAVPQRKQAQRS